jgi:hypothetical protein
VKRHPDAAAYGLVIPFAILCDLRVQNGSREKLLNTGSVHERKKKDRAAIPLLAAPSRPGDFIGSCFSVGADRSGHLHHGKKGRRYRQLMHS